MTSRIRTKRVYDATARADGARILIMRLWPRGIRKERVDRWLRELGPVVELLRAFRGGRLTWPQYRRRYLAGLRRPEARAQLAEVRALARRGPVTLLCGCPVEARCHRSLLRAHLQGRTPARAASRPSTARRPRPRRPAARTARRGAKRVL
jgi:uncharacterized protein YeaO (DUF488 family)